ncbi:MAG TPA: metal-dependent hydrolase [Casimicrobiaceae bacterium]|nr:metal-dependent hydrolase [Casimicrobiaceae bacterium]
MFIGHIGLALAAKRVAPKPSLGTLTLAAQLVDGVWPVFLLLGWEQVQIVPGITAVTPLLFVSYPYTHSLVAGVLWGALLGGSYYALRRDRNGALWLFALVLSHWVLDFISHRPDMPLWPGGPRVGLGLWYSVPATLVAEFGLFGFGVWLYTRVTRPRDALGSILFWLFVAVLAVLYVMSVFGPPPPSVQVLALSGLLGWLFLAWAYWIDRHRETVA